MKLYILLILLVSFAYAVVVITDPYDGIQYDQINTYEMKNDNTYECSCWEYY